ncbi:lysophospholipid acyltransferase family protein [Bdellovibrio sp. SKB1291214]|uniref:lysophospholipid acyltransferase family protein n=1 Tax=Bdellovibrio sp. SKB1291214 TaxID=1732569 RepID=UPI000B517940|nr:lysophospholipid acyltransferase family protein [Bdellovibrio sp. SKB1291214]UYL08526.1 lysophospholipid acyltransferase family protein [Bdellovibrio sp. SKB1291214]
MKLLVSFLAKLGIFLSSILPRRIQRLSGSWIGFLWWDIFGFRKKIVLNNLEIAFPEWTVAERKKVGRESVYQLGYNFGEFFFIPNMDRQWVDKNVVFDGLENYEKAVAMGKGFFYLTLHLGNGDLAANALSVIGQDINIITKRFKTQWFDDLWFSIRGAGGVKYIDAHGPTNAFDILKALKRNSGLVFVLDQYMGKPFGVATSFFGKRTGTAYGLALFAQKTKAPVLPIYTYEGADGKVHVVIEPAMDLSPSIVEDKDQSIVNLTQSFNDKLESIIRKHPEQWMWVHRRWKDF